MMPIILVSPDTSLRTQKAQEYLLQNKLSQNHPDVLWIDDEKLGVEKAKQIREHLSLKPYQGKIPAVVVINAQNFTPEAQNSLLKTFEEPSSTALLILGAASDSQLLPTILSRCQIHNLLDTRILPESNKYEKEFEDLLKSDIATRFTYIEKLTDKEIFFHSLVNFFHLRIKSHPGDPEFLKNLLQAEKWLDANVSIRPILEYLMLKMPKE
ncbi:MAG: hypothetical protein Q7S88_00600 [Candidatus Daviesbacteria bacterium]|nr:hypothetical protein [Candidatus Daviesbacteria bacterium]